MTPKQVLPKRLPLTRVKTGSRWMRIYAQGRNALWFGPDSGCQPIHRFDDPTGRFRVCYLGTTLEVCFAETFLRNPPVRILALDDLANMAPSQDASSGVWATLIHTLGYFTVTAAAEFALYD